MHRKIYSFLATLIFLFPLLAACGNSNTGGSSGQGSTGSTGSSSANTGQSGTTSSGGKTITIGSKNFTEAKLLGEMYAQVLEANGYKVNRKLNLGSTQILDKALQTGQIDVYPDYTGTLLSDIVKANPNAAKYNTPEKTYKAVQQFYANRDPKDTLLQPANYQNTNAMVVTQDDAKKYNLKTYADLEKQSPKLVFATWSEFLQRADSFKLLKKNYPNMNFKKNLILNSISPQRYVALTQNRADVTVGFTTDPQIAQYHLVILKDEKNIWPYYYPVPVINSKYLQAHPDVKAIFNKVSSTLTVKDMQKLNGQVDVQHEDVSKVAHDYLTKKGLLK